MPVPELVSSLGRSVDPAEIRGREDARLLSLGFITENFKLELVGGGRGGFNQELLLVAVSLISGDVITGVALGWSNTPAGTNFYTALYSASGARLAVSADLASTVNVAGPLVAKFPFTAQYVVPASGLYYAACLDNGGTPPTLLASNGGSTDFHAGYSIDGVFPRRAARQAGAGSTPPVAATLADMTNTGIPWMGVY